ncbi:uncharacterized protein [Amphiura filiformis]|uniref:uncharacterized protein isoform X2 n=1 Tax=Amphiura filiformis TaxID=82378 RepID=UPI003B214E19
MKNITYLFLLFSTVNLEVSSQCLEQEIKNYLNYYSQVPGPFQELAASNPTQVYTYAKTAEHAVEQYNNKYQVVYRLRGIVSYKEISKSVVTFTLRVQARGGGEVIHGLFHVHQTSHGEKQTTTLLSSVVPLAVPKKSTCDKISREANCSKCDDLGRCIKGQVPLDPWLAFAMKTQREIQIDQSFVQVQYFAAHNAFNDRADGYGEADDCPWPPPYHPECFSLANQEFSFTDMLNMGYHALEIDPWWCFDKIRLSHATDHALGCAPVDRHFEDAIMEIGQWVHKPENQGKVIRLYFEDGEDHTQGHDELINGPIQQYLRNKVFTPSDKNDTFGGKWPTIRQLRKLNKTVIISTSGTYTHGGAYIHDGYWNETIVNEFTPYPKCGGKTSSNILRFYCDSTNYGPFWDGPKETGVILNFTEFVKCRIQYPAADQVNPSLLKTGVFTWAEGQPASPLANTSCVFLDISIHSWKVSSNCTTQLFSACVNRTNNEHWTISQTPSAYNSKPSCPDAFQFGLPVNGFQQQKIIEVAKNVSVWINLTPYISLLMATET